MNQNGYKYCENVTLINNSISEPFLSKINNLINLLIEIINYRVKCETEVV